MARPSPPPSPDDGAARVGRVLLSVALAAAAVLGARGIGDEGAVSLQGDMPRHLMNGVFMLDFLSNPTWSVDGVLTYAQQYFARYPALSIGHHPPLLPASLVPFYAVLGVSVFAGRVALVGFFVAATWMLYVVARRQYDRRVGGWAALFFATNPFLVVQAQSVLSEMLTLLVVLSAIAALLRFRESGRVGDYLAFVGLAAASLAAKQLAAFLFPVYAALLLTGSGRRNLTNRHVMAWTIAGFSVTVLVIVATLFLSPYNVDVVLGVLSRLDGFLAWRDTLTPILAEHLWPSLVFVTAAGVALAIVERDRRVFLSLGWILSVVSCLILFTGPYEAARYGIYAVPAFCLLGASMAASSPSGRWSVVLGVTMAAALAGQVALATTVRPTGAGGYEAAARFVLAHPGAPTVLYSAPVDTGYFVFFVRKHDVDRRLVVLRSDKIFTTSLMGTPNVSDRIHAPEEIYSMLDRYGTRFVVIEDRPSESQVLDWLREAVKSERFVERQRIPIVSSDRRLQHVDLAIYEYKEAKPGDPDAEIEMDLPLARRGIRVRLSDLQPARPR